MALVLCPFHSLLFFLLQPDMLWYDWGSLHDEMWTQLLVRRLSLYTFIFICKTRVGLLACHIVCLHCFPGSAEHLRLTSILDLAVLGLFLFYYNRFKALFTSALEILSVTDFVAFAVYNAVLPSIQWTPWSYKRDSNHWISPGQSGTWCPSCEESGTAHRWKQSLFVDSKLQSRSWVTRPVECRTVSGALRLQAYISLIFWCPYRMYSLISKNHLTDIL